MTHIHHEYFKSNSRQVGVVHATIDKQSITVIILPKAWKSYQNPYEILDKSYQNPSDILGNRTTMQR